ncbi:Hsp70 family protein [Micromonospora sp. DT233]|uniref:Hsp70 family protein n=1 Tax=Micromonospora sp. DT233 TaxID=3393432 RepID=UPI003CEF5AC7
MQSGEARLSIDCGSVSTVAVLAWPDGRWTPLRFDGEPQLPSSVFLAPDGTVVTGQRAWQGAVEHPDRFVPAPRQPSEQQLTVAGVEVSVADLVAATLRRVAGEAERIAGGPVQDVRLVVPAGWGPRRRTWMRQVAHRAGLPQPRLVEAPIAVAEHLLTTGTQLPVGALIAVCDIGGECETTVMRRGPGGFEVLATLADPAAGGTTIDSALTRLLPSEAGDGGQRWAVVASVRVAKESLASHAAVTVPLPAGAVVLNASMLEQAAEPALRRAAQLIMEAVAAAEVTLNDLSGIYLVGGSAQLPLAHTYVVEQTSRQSALLPDPALAAARGAADVGGHAPGSAVDGVEEGPPVPPVRRAVAIAVPGFASLAMIAQFLLSAIWHGSELTAWAMLNWGELTMAAVFAVLASLSAGTILGSLLAAHDPTAGPRTPASQVGTGILAAVSLGMAIAGMYAVVASLYYRLEVGPFLRWALLPIAPTVIVAAVMALVAARQWRTPRGGWSDFLAFPLSPLITAAAGMALMAYFVTAERPPDLVLWIDLAGRIGGFLIGVGIVTTVVSPMVLRLILGAPVAIICAVIVNWRAIGILGVAYAIAVAAWWIGRLWNRVLRANGPAPHGR